MKGQILSRIQSYQYIPAPTTSSLQRIPASNTLKLIHEAKTSQHALASTDNQPRNGSLNPLSPPAKRPNVRLFTSSHALTSVKKMGGSGTRAVNYDGRALLATGTEGKGNVMGAKMSQKLLPSRTLYRDAKDRLGQHSSDKKSVMRQGEQGRSLNCLGSARKNTSEKSQENGKIHFQSRRRQLIKMYGRNDFSKISKTAVASEQNIRTLPDGQDAPKDPELAGLRKANLMTRTINVFKDYKHTPYFNLSNKKLSMRSPHKEGLPRSAYRIDTAMYSEKDEVSIEISGEDLNREQVGLENMGAEFGCSEIKEALCHNDSSFLDQDQREIILELGEIEKKEGRKRVWKKLPNDFLKV